MLYRLMVLRCAPLLWRCSICIVLWMETNECVCSMRYFAKCGVWPFVLNVALCSSNRAKIFFQFAPHTSCCSPGMSVCTPRIIQPKIRLLAPLPNRDNLENTTHLIKKLKDTPILPQFALASLDITNVYTNFPVTETREVIANAQENNLLDSQNREELIRWHDTITEQNYFTKNGKIMIQKDGLAMGASTSSLIAENKTQKHSPSTLLRQTQDRRLLPLR